MTLGQKEKLVPWLAWPGLALLTPLQHIHGAALPSALCPLPFLFPFSAAICDSPSGQKAFVRAALRSRWCVLPHFASSNTRFLALISNITSRDASLISS